MSPNMDARRESRLPETIRRIIEKKYATREKEADNARYMSFIVTSEQNHYMASTAHGSWQVRQYEYKLF